MEQITQLETQRIQYREDLKLAESGDEKIRIINLIEHIENRINEILNKK